MRPGTRLARLKRRSEFLRAAGRGRKWATPGLVLQACQRPAIDGGPDLGPPRVGFTASRKVGNAVARNRARRRLRAVADAVLPAAGKPGTDYVLIARAGTLTRDFPDLVADLQAALARVAQERGGRGPAGRSRRGSRPEPRNGRGKAPSRRGDGDSRSDGKKGQ